MFKTNSNLLTDVGLVRKANEDCFGEVNTSNTTKNGHVFIVCDGMGGHVGGAVASQMAVDCIIDYFNKDFHDNIYLAIEKSISFANNQILLRSQSDSSLKGMGTTCTVLVQRDNELFIGHVGDSRIYIQTDGKLSRLTKDHSYVQTLVDKGEITDSEMELHPRKNELTQALGVAESVKVEVCNTPILAKVGDKILMCSDGLCGFVSDKVISQALQSDSIIKSNNALVSLANNAGGGDNITVGLIEILESPHHNTVFENKNNTPHSLNSTQEVDIIPLPEKDQSRIKKFVYIVLPLLISVVLFFSFYDFGGSSFPSKAGKESNQENTSNKTENPTSYKDDQSNFEWKVDSIIQFRQATVEFQKEFKKQKGSEGKTPRQLQAHIRNNSKFSFNGADYSYQEAKENFNESDKTLEGGVFTVSYFVANESLLNINSPVKIKELTPEIPSENKDCEERQKKLKEAGYYTGKIDGDCGKGTEKAELEFEADKDSAKKIKKLEEKGWSRKKPKFGNIDPVKFNVVILDKIKEILHRNLDTEPFNFKLSTKKDVVLYHSSIKVEDVNKEIKSINKQINENNKIDSVSFSETEVSPSYPLKVNGVSIGYYNYKEKEDTKEKQNEEDSTNEEEIQEEGQEEPDKSND